MSAALFVPRIAQPALTRLIALTPLDGEALALLREAADQPQPVRARTELIVDGRPVAGPRLILSGWAARTKIMIDGRRQFQSFLLPGDFVGMCTHPQPLAVSTVVALTDMSVCVPPAAERSRSLAAAYGVSQALEEAYLLGHIVRLGRLHAQERIADLLLELNERLTLSGLATDGRFQLPMTQEMMGDALGLTSVHINRRVQQARREGDLEWRNGAIHLPDPAALARKVGRTPIRVSALQLP